MPLNYTNSIPLHLQLKQTIYNKIQDGVYDTQIPSERELMDEYYVSRSTVRQAIAQLVSEDILEKRPGKGTFVKVKPIHSWLGNLHTTAETIEQMGMRATVQLQKARKMTLPPILRSQTGLEEAYYFERIRLANDLPIGIERSYYPIAIGEKLVQFDLNKASFYELLEKELGIKALSSDQEISAGEFSKEDTALLAIPSKSIYLGAERTIKDLDGEFIEYEFAQYRSDMYAFHIQASRKNK